MTSRATKPLAKRRAVKRPSASASFGKRDPEITDDDLKALVPGGIITSFVDSKLHDKAVAVAGLGEPSDWDGEMPELPNDIATLDHDGLSNLHAQFTNAYSTSIWYASKNYVEADAYEEIKEYLENVALGNSEQSNETKRKAEARTNEGVVAAESLRRQRYRDYVRFRDLANTLDRRARAVSRIGGFMGDEADNEDTKASRSSTRGKALGQGRGSAKGSAKLRSRR